MFSLISSLSLAQHGLPQPCSYPLQFTAQVHTFYYGRNVMERGQVSYDGVNERVYESGESRSPDGKDYAKIWDYKSGYEYYIEGVDEHRGVAGTCYYSKIPTSQKTWHKFGIPSTARFHAQVTAGLYPTTFDVNEWSVSETYAGSKGNYTVEGWHHVTADECMPTSTHEFIVDGKTGVPDWESSASSDWYNAVLGVADPSVFIPPSDCKPKPPPAPPTPPGPKPPSPPHSVCTPALIKYCGPVEHKGATCDTCVTKNKVELTKAGCTAAIEVTFCHAPAPPPPHSVCTPALVKACGTLEHKGATCTACVKTHNVTLHAAGCTAAIESEFCMSKPPAPPHTVCTPALVKACGADEHKGAVCHTCVTKNKVELTKAGCTAEIEAEFCDSAPPPPPHTVCHPALVKACGTLEHKGATCTACVAKEAGNLKASGCTAAMESEFCDPTMF